MKVSRYQVLDFLIMVMRWYLAFYMISYGWDKMTGGQFAVHDPAILDRPLKEVNEFYIAWYLFSLSTSFNLIVGITQLLGGALLLFNRTVLVGALVLLPVLFNIFLIDLAFTTNMFGSALPVRLMGMILCNILIMVYYKERMVAIWKNLTVGLTTKFRYNWWVFPIFFILGFLMDFILAIVFGPLKFFLNWLLGLT